MEQVKTSLALLISILLQWSLARVAPQFVFVDFPLLVVIYVALQRESLKAMIYATIAGIAVDALSGGLLGAGGFSKTITAFVIAELARRFLVLDNSLLRIPVIAGASLLAETIYFAMHRLLGQTSSHPFLETIAYSAIGTSIVGTILMLLNEWFFSDRARQRRATYNPKRGNNTRRSSIRLGRRV